MHTGPHTSVDEFSCYIPEHMYADPLGVIREVYQKALISPSIGINLSALEPVFTGTEEECEQYLSLVGFVYDERADEWRRRVA